MTGAPISRQTAALMELMAPLMRFFTQSRWSDRQGAPGISDFVAGNPQEPPLPAFVDALQRWTEPKDNQWFAYKPNDPGARAAVAESLRRRRGMPFEDEDIFLTNGAFAALAIAMRAVADPGDEIVYISPPWFFYESMIQFSGAVPVRVDVKPPAFDLDLDAIAKAITPRTRAIIVNSPHNPTGRIYPPQVLAALADLLTEASNRQGRPIYLLSDEAYHRILFDGRAYPSPTEHYPYSFLIYTWAKTLLTPGQRLGYIALPPTMPDRERLRGAIFMTQIVGGFLFPNAVLQYAVGELDDLSIDIGHLQKKRDLMVGALRDAGYELGTPEGTFYLLPRSPIPDDMAFTEQLAERDVFVLPGALVELPGYFRISLTGNDQMIERALPVFASALQGARGHEPEGAPIPSIPS